jgi:hypothetical protein
VCSFDLKLNGFGFSEELLVHRRLHQVVRLRLTPEGTAPRLFQYTQHPHSSTRQPGGLCQGTLPVQAGTRSIFKAAPEIRRVAALCFQRLEANAVARGIAPVSRTALASATLAWWTLGTPRSGRQGQSQHASHGQREKTRLCEMHDGCPPKQHRLKSKYAPCPGQGNSLGVPHYLAQTKTRPRQDRVL